jgi:hypothetical protein
MSICGLSQPRNHGSFSELKSAFSLRLRRKVLPYGGQVRFAFGQGFSESLRSGVSPGPIISLTTGNGEPTVSLEMRFFNATDENT